MKRFLTKFALLVLIAGLPLQNMHAVAMPLCDQVKLTAAADHQSAHDEEMAEHGHAGDQHPSADTGAGCDGCSMCNACSAPAIPSVKVDLLVDAVEKPPVVRTSHVLLFIPEQPQRPPSAALA